MAQAKYDAVRGMRHLTIEVRVIRANELRWRMRLGVWLIKIATRVMNCNVEFLGYEP